MEKAARTRMFKHIFGLLVLLQTLEQMNVRGETGFIVKKETYSSDKLISILSWLMRQLYSNINKTSVKAVVIISIANTDSGLTTFTGFLHCHKINSNIETKQVLCFRKNGLFPHLCPWQNHAFWRKSEMETWKQLMKNPGEDLHKVFSSIIFSLRRLMVLFCQAHCRWRLQQ